MRLLTSRNSAEERLTSLVTQGYELRVSIWKDRQSKLSLNAYQSSVDVPRYKAILSGWIQEVQHELRAIFPTSLELHKFSARASHLATDFRDVDQAFGVLFYIDIPRYIELLASILESDVRRYTDLPIAARLYVEDIDSFSRVRDVNPAAVANLLPGGYLHVSEDVVQMSLEQILDVPVHKKDWGGELNDMYTANVMVNGVRRAAAFLLKGPGIGRREMSIADCGKKGDQLVRLFTTPANLFVVQYVGPIAEMVVQDAATKTAELRARGEDAHFLIMDGQDTARVLHAYGKL